MFRSEDDRWCNQRRRAEHFVICIQGDQRAHGFGRVIIWRSSKDGGGTLFRLLRWLRARR